MPHLFAHYFVAEVVMECLLEQLLILSCTHSLKLLFFKKAVAVVVVVGVLEEWREGCMHYRIPVALVLILSQEALKQLASSVVTGDDPTCVSLHFQCEQQKP